MFPATPIRILGIDPGSNITGYGLIEATGRRLAHVENGVIRPKARTPYPSRLDEIFDGLTALIRQYRPDLVAIEDVFYAKNAKSTLQLGQARGVAILAAAQAKLVVHEYATRVVKQSLTGYGNASKQQIQFMTAKLLRLPEPATEDAADALAVAITHAQHQ